jgi:hypothetical protein
MKDQQHNSDDIYTFENVNPAWGKARATLLVSSSLVVCGLLLGGTALAMNTADRRAQPQTSQVGQNLVARHTAPTMAGGNQSEVAGASPSGKIVAVSPVVTGGQYASNDDSTDGAEYASDDDTYAGSDDDGETGDYGDDESESDD